MGGYVCVALGVWAIAIIGVLRFFHVASRQGEARAVLFVVHGGARPATRCTPRRRELQ
jgi:hypothetical protein